MVKYTIAIDAMGGDNAPKSIIDGLAISSIRNPSSNYIVFGDEKQIGPLIKDNKQLKKVSKVVHVEDWIRGDEKASKSIRRSKTTSMGLSIASVANGEADAVVSSGNSGALLAMSILGLRKLPGISRPALAAVMPTISGEVIALDLGANIDCSSQNLIDFSVMGIVFAQNVLGRPNPRLAFLNVGEEANKGNSMINEASRLMENSYFARFYKGYVEGDKVFSGNFDVIVKVSYAIGRSSFLGVRKKMDPRKHNGAVLLGLNGIVVKSHGGTDSIGFAHAVDLATEMSIGNYNELIKNELNKLKSVVHKK